jgi:hypothetical protein
MSSSQVLVIFLLILLNGFFVLSEMALVSAKRSRLQTAAEQGVSGAKSAIALLEDPTTLLSAIQIGITLITIFTGLYGGETFAGPLAEKLTSYGVPVQYTAELAKGIVVLIITFVTLIVGEVVPKRVALLHAETLALRVAPLMRVIARITAPAIWLLRVAVNAFLKVLPVSAAPQAAVTEDDVRALVAEGTRGGRLPRSERRLVEGRAGAGRPQGRLDHDSAAGHHLARHRRADPGSVAAGEVERPRALPRGTREVREPARHDHARESQRGRAPRRARSGPRPGAAAAHPGFDLGAAIAGSVPALEHAPRSGDGRVWRDRGHHHAD